MKTRILFSLLLSAIFTPFMKAEDSPDRFWNHGRGYAPFSHATEKGIEIDNRSHAAIIDSCILQNPLTDFTLTFRATNLNSKPGHRYTYTQADGKKGSIANPAWGFFISSPQGKRTWFSVFPVEKHDPVSSSTALRIVVNADETDSTVYSATVGSGLNPFDGTNVWRLIKSGDGLVLSAGDKGMTEITTLHVSGKCNAFGFAASPGASIRITDISLTQVSSLSDMEAGEWKDLEKLDRYFADSGDDIEGYWTVFDRTLDEARLRMGGDYRLAIVKSGGAYDIIYIDGAKTNSVKWKKGMVKGRLYPGPFPGIFDVEWIDAEGKPLRRDIKAQSGEGDTLTIQFPYQSSTIRLRRIPASYSSGMP